MTGRHVSAAGAVIASAPAVILGLTYLIAPVPQDQKIFVATGAFALATIARLLLIPPPKDVLASHMFHLPWLFNVLVIAIPVLALWLQDERIIKSGPTLYFGIVAALSGWSVLTGTPRLQRFVRRDSLRSVGRAGWRKLTLFATGSCLLMALINEVVWRNSSTGFWLSFQIFGWLAIEMLLMALSLPIIRRHDFKYGAATAQDQGPVR